MRCTRPCLALPLLFLLPFGAIAQDDALILAHDELVSLPDLSTGSEAPIEVYEALNAVVGGDSARLCNGYACSGWVEDRYPDGSILHRGYYTDGHLVTYRNFHPGGALEREFKAVDNTRSVLRTFHPNGQLRSETRHMNGVALAYTEHYASGQVRYAEEKHRSEPYYLRMDLFQPDGRPISTLRLVDKRTVTFEQAEHWPDGQLRCKGQARYDPRTMDTRRIGTWTYYDMKGMARFEEAYVDGKVHELKPLLTQAR